MNMSKKYKIIFIILIAVILFFITQNRYNHRVIDEIACADGIKTAVVKQNGKNGHRIIFDEGHSMYNLNIGGEYIGSAFSPTGRYFAFTYMSQSGLTQYTELIDFKLEMSGLGAVEITSRMDDNFLPQLKDPFILKDLYFDFVCWHESEDYMLYNYTATDINGGTTTGYVWYSPEYYEQRLVATDKDI